ncbi:hypothetical protein GCM10010401_12490 [Rarobacter faecitabidus]
MAAWAFAGVCWGLGAAAIVLHLVTGDVPDILADWIMDLTVTAIYPIVVLILLPRVRAAAVWVLMALALGCALVAFGEQYDALGGRPFSLPGQGIFAYGRIWMWMPGTYGLIAVLPWLIRGGVRHPSAPEARPAEPGAALPHTEPGTALPHGRAGTALPHGEAGIALPHGEGRLQTRSWRERARTLVPAAALSIAAVAIVLATVRNATILLPPPSPPNPLSVASWQGFTGRLGLWPEWVITGIGVLALAYLISWWRAERAAGRPRTGIGWLIAAQALLIVAFVLFLWPVGPELADAAAEVSGTALIIAQAFLPGAVLVLVLGRRLWGVDATVSRWLTWTVMTVIVVASYFIIIGLVGAWLPVDSSVSVAIAIGAVTLAITPARRRVQQRVDHLVYGALATPRRASTAVWSSLDDGTGDLGVIAESLRDGMRLAAVRINPTGSASVPSAQDEDSLALVSRGREVGTLVVASRPGERLDARTLSALEQVARLLAIVVDLQQLNSSLTTARARLVDIRQDERRSLRRDLHDGLGPAIAGLRLAVGAAINQLAADPDKARGMLERVHDELARRGDDIRLISRSMAPAELEDGDLAGALARLADRFSSGALLVTAHVAPGAELPASHQVAIYHIAAEALMNVHRHSGPSRCELRVRGVPGGDDLGSSVVVEVRDDGHGFADANAGVGLSSMRERAEELGGTFAIVSTVAPPSTADPNGTQDSSNNPRAASIGAETPRTASAGTTIRVTLPAQARTQAQVGSPARERSPGHDKSPAAQLS